ncbi:hypothetical protein TELCIR_22795, partial [Teladorsagia circumcincta]
GMRLLLAFLALCAGISTGIKIRESKNYLEDNRFCEHDVVNVGVLLIHTRVPPLREEKNSHGTSQFKYKYVSICVNGTGDNLLDIVHAKECDDKESQVALGRYTNQVNTTG